MTREELISTLKTLLNENQEDKIIVLINTAIAYINWYTFQNYSLSSFPSMPYDIFMVIIELVKDKYYQKMVVCKTESKREYYRQGAQMSLKRDETVDLVPNQLEELKQSYKVRRDHIDKLYIEAKQIKHLPI